MCNLNELVADVLRATLDGCIIVNRVINDTDVPRQSINWILCL